MLAERHPQHLEIEVMASHLVVLLAAAELAHLLLAAYVAILADGRAPAWRHFAVLLVTPVLAKAYAAAFALARANPACLHGRSASSVRAGPGLYFHM